MKSINRFGFSLELIPVAVSKESSNAKNIFQIFSNDSMGSWMLQGLLIESFSSFLGNQLINGMNNSVDIYLLKTSEIPVLENSDDPNGNKISSISEAFICLLDHLFTIQDENEFFSKCPKIIPVIFTEISSQIQSKFGGDASEVLGRILFENSICLALLNPLEWIGNLYAKLDVSKTSNYLFEIFSNMLLKIVSSKNEEFNISEEDSSLEIFKTVLEAKKLEISKWILNLARIFSNSPNLIEANSSSKETPKSIYDFSNETATDLKNITAPLCANMNLIISNLTDNLKQKPLEFEWRETKKRKLEIEEEKRKEEERKKSTNKKN
eukprot:c20340_g1_i2.p1 GENE.c20340_g1_i2~~c20340_g1_i2.p1  ORF type:complete len:324 (-),score=96.47 c20340_g1_i2:560-1531(-)